MGSEQFPLGKQHLKSNMDRFILSKQRTFTLVVLNLKSNMDRFI